MEIDAILVHKKKLFRRRQFFFRRTAGASCMCAIRNEKLDELPRTLMRIPKFTQQFGEQMMLMMTTFVWLPPHPSPWFGAGLGSGSSAV